MQPGMPTDADYQQVINSEAFRALDEFSQQFIEEHQQTLRAFSRKWVSNPLQQWSRRWEYPFVLEAIQALLESAKVSGSENDSKLCANVQQPKLKILDAGSGVTFFPYYLQNRYSNVELYCCDYDGAFAPAYEKLNAVSKDKTQQLAANVSPIKFDQADLRQLPHDDQSFDLIYCISVLEHTDCYGEIISEFNRVLANGGRLVISFDISMDGSRDISLEETENLLASVQKNFASFELSMERLRQQVKAPDLFTTHKARVIDPQLLPWKYPSILYQCQSLLQGKGLVAWPPELGVYCLVAEK